MEVDNHASAVVVEWTVPAVEFRQGVVLLKKGRYSNTLGLVNRQDEPKAAKIWEIFCSAIMGGSRGNCGQYFKHGECQLLVFSSSAQGALSQQNCVLQLPKASSEALLVPSRQPPASDRTSPFTVCQVSPHDNIKLNFVFV